MIKAAIQANPPEAATEEPRRMLNEQQVLEILPISRVTLWRMEKEGRFPKATYVSPNRRLWFADEVARWQETVDERDPQRGRGRNKRRRRTVEREQLAQQ